MDLSLLSGILLLVASALAVFSVIKNRNSQKIIGRAEFIIFLLVAALPSIYLAVADIAFLSGSAERLPYTELVLKIWFFWLAAIAYHFYTQNQMKTHVQSMFKHPATHIITTQSMSASKLKKKRDDETHYIF